ncbi:hypothetical protein [Endozoicomonas arenosclerae]|uniref:hypothetical protein n=1 Tax=Endozoicomonas arenosclerae TaxID=1633495 RepID=UPI00078525F9|nr:hypothetical protein [Endozoicomonas arenosclerae]
MSTGKTDGIPANQSPITHSVPTSETEASGKTANNQTVTKTVPKNNIPRDRLYRSGVPLRQRAVREEKVSNSPMQTFIAWVSGRPKPSDIEEAKGLALQLAGSIGGEESKPEIEFKNRRTTLNRKSPEHKACLLLVEAGLATIESKDVHTITFRLLRPHDLPRQQELAEFLCTKIPVELASNGSLDWNAVFKGVDPVMGNSLQLSGLVPYIGNGKYQTNNESRRALASFRQMQAKANEHSKPQQYWQSRIERLKAIALPNRIADLDQCKRAVRNSQNEPPYILETVAVKFRNDNEHAIADELEIAYEELCNNEAGGAQTNANGRLETIEESPVDQTPWDEIKSVFREMNLIDQVVDLPTLGPLAEAYESRLPFKLPELARTAMLLEKERELKAHYDTLGLPKGTKMTEEKLKKLEAQLDEMDFDRTANVFKEGSEWSTSAEEQQEFRHACQSVKEVYEELKASTPRPSIEQMAEKLLDVRPIPRLRYSENQWALAHRILTQGY